MAGPGPFIPPRGGRGSQSAEAKPVPSSHWQPPESVEASDFWRYQPGGVFLGWSGSVPIGVKDDRHLLTIAGARAGKTSTVLIPNLMLYEGSALVLDPKGELASKTADHRASVLGHTVHVLDPWGLSGVTAAKYDPLADLRAGHPDDLVDDAALIAEALISDSGENNAHWTESARAFLRALMLWMIHGAHGEPYTLAALPSLLAAALADDKKDDDKDDTPTLFEAMAWLQPHADTPPEVLDVIRNAGEGMIGTSSRERASILSTARNQLGFLESPQLRASLERSTFALADLKTAARPVTVYLCLPASRMGTHAGWLRLVLNLAMAALERAKVEPPPPLPVLFMLEEFAALGYMRALEQASAYMASFGVKLWTVLQDLTQLKRHYKDGWETFIGNAGILQAFGGADQTTLEYLSKRLGETSVYIEEEHAAGTHAQSGGDTGIRKNFQRVPLLSPDEVAINFGRRFMSALVIAPDGRPITLQRRFVDDPAFKALIRQPPPPEPEPTPPPPPPPGPASSLRETILGASNG